MTIFTLVFDRFRFHPPDLCQLASGCATSKQWMRSVSVPVDLRKEKVLEGWRGSCWWIWCDLTDLESQIESIRYTVYSMCTYVQESNQVFWMET